MKRFLLWGLDHPLAVVGVVALVTVALGAQLPRIQIDESAEGLMVEADPAREYYERAKRRFGSDNLTIILVKAPDVFTPEVLGVVKRLSDGLQRLEGVERVESLTTVKNIKGDGDLLNTEPLVGSAVPTAPDALARIRADALSNRVFVGNLVSASAGATAIVVYADPKPGDTRFNQRFVAQVDALIARESAGGLTIYQLGRPLTKVTYAQFIKSDQRTVIPISMAVLLLVLFVAFRTPQGVVIPVVTALVSIIWAIGLMAITGLPLTVLTGIIPSLLLAIGFTEDVHMISEYHHRVELGDDKLTAIRAMLEDIALPLLVTTVTTVLGFASLALTNIPMLVQFGYGSAMALTANFVVTILLLPVMLRLWRVPHHQRSSALESGSRPDIVTRLMERLARFNLRYRVQILIVAALLTVGSLAGWATLRVDTDLISFFPARSEIRTRIVDIHESLAGALAFYVVVDTNREDGLKDPGVLRMIAGLQEFLASTGKVDKSVSVADYVRKMHREMNGGAVDFERIPDTSDQVAQYLLMLEGTELAKFVDFNSSAANVVVRHNLTGSGGLSALLKQLDAHVAGHFPPNVTVRYTGETILFNNAADYMAINEITGFSTTFVVIGLIHAALFMSLKAGALSLIPNLVPIVCLYGLMGLIGIPLNISTAMIATIAIGIAVDDTVHHMVTYSRELKVHHDQTVAMFNTMKSQGRPIIYVSLALAAGFLTLVFSSLAPTVYFGLLAASVMILAMFGELILTPILMYSVRLITLWDLVMLKMDPDMVRTAPLLDGLSQWETRKVLLMGRLQALAPGEFAVRKGESGTEMYMVVTGQLRVFDRRPDGQEKVLVVLEPGTVFGEMGLVTGEVRSANVVADTSSEVVRLDYQALERIRKRFPYTSAKLFRNLARILSARLRQTTMALVGERAPLVADAAVPPGLVRGD
jgi:hypothetical protein